MFSLAQSESSQNPLRTSFLARMLPYMFPEEAFARSSFVIGVIGETWRIQMPRVTGPRMTQLAEVGDKAALAMTQRALEEWDGCRVCVLL